MNKLILTNVFKKQVKTLLKKYIKIEEDLNLFDSNFQFESFSDLGNGLRKYRVKNSSIPTGKRGGFRLILKEFYGNNIPISIYSKTEKENITSKEIENLYSLIINELKNK